MASYEPRRAAGFRTVGHDPSEPPLSRWSTLCHGVFRLSPLATALLLGRPRRRARRRPRSRCRAGWRRPTRSPSDVLQVWAPNVEKATNGRVKFHMLPNTLGASGHLRRGARRPGRRLLRHRELHAGAPPAAADRRAARRRRHRRDQLGRVLPHPLEVPAGGQRVQGREAARGLHPRARPDVPGEEAGDRRGRPGRHEDPERRRHLRGVGQGARRLAAGEAGAGVVRDPVVGHRRRHFLPVGIDQVLQPRQGRQVRDLLSLAGLRPCCRSASS